MSVYAINKSAVAYEACRSYIIYDPWIMEDPNKRGGFNKSIVGIRQRESTST